MRMKASCQQWHLCRRDPHQNNVFFKGIIGKWPFLHRIQCEKLFEINFKWTKLNTFKSWDSHAVWRLVLTLQKPKMSLELLHDVHRKALRPWLIIWLMHLFVKRLPTPITLWKSNDFRKFDADAILFWDIQWKKMDILMFKQCFQYGFGWDQVKYARITITHVCFIALTLAGPLGRCLNTQPNGLVFKQLPLDPANVNAWKNMCDPYIHGHFPIITL